MPSSGSSARMASTKASCGASFCRRACHLGLPLQHLVAARGAARIGFRQRVDQSAQDRRGVADQRDLRLVQARRLLAVGIDAHDLQILVDAPGRHRIEQPRADAEHRVGLAPQVAAERQRDAERVAAVEHAAAAPVGEHRRLQHVGEQRHLGRGILRAAADDDEDALGLAEQLRRRAHGVLVDARRALRQRRHAASPRPRLPQTSMAHSSAAGPRRPCRIEAIALATFSGASAGAWMCAE